MPVSHDNPAAGEDEPLRRDVRLLGELLGETVRARHGEELFQLIEEVRALAKRARRGEQAATPRLIGKLSALPAGELLLLARAFTLFLNLANIAEQHHQLRRQRATGGAAAGLDAELRRLRGAGISAGQLHRQVAALSIDLVLTAHPTEVMRRSLAAKFQRIAGLLAARDARELPEAQQARLRRELHRAIAEVWATDEIRRRRPTPLDEAKTCLVTVEHSLWDAVPRVARELDDALLRHAGGRLPLESAPIRFGSWMGGDRDGNPNTTPAVTKRVCLLNKLKAAQMFLADIDELRRDLSMRECSPALRREAGDAAEPYRALLEKVTAKLTASVRHYAAQFDAPQDAPRAAHEKNGYAATAQLRAPLRLCYDSLLECGEGLIAEGRLSDILRRLDAFGLTMLKLDIRQEAQRHTAALDAITRYLGLGGYAEWDEARRQEFLIAELNSKRPLIASTFPRPGEADAESAEVLATFRMLASENPESFGAYVISMAAMPSDVLAVALLQKECRVARPLRVVPLFERIDALRGAAACMRRLFEIDWYRERIGGRQEVMIGYSDSAKDAGILSAAWGLYQAQAELVEVFAERGVELTLFHGRGGTVARGGGPAAQAIRSQPPGSVGGSMRVTEQGEVVQAKYGLPGMAEATLRIYVSAVLEATLAPPPAPQAAWREQISQLARDALEEFQGVVQRRADFAEYFHLATPLRELGGLKIGSRPARRRRGDDIQGLRAIPWIFAWTQTRLMLPAWLGVGAALRKARERGDLRVLTQMREKWPFFRATLDSIEMVFSKANPNVSALYDARLVGKRLAPLGELLREKYRETVRLLLEVSGHRIPLEDEAVVRRSVDVRNTYVIPLNLLQAELLSRLRGGARDDGEVADALLIAINGIAAGMRNSG